ncbi:MAG: hypothetical protein D6819_10005 [Gammaproteobacteria bacterium]|nr:MAG: hypothetical protein D6819_10005 [Gammaproteobacteria bacterium]
MKRFAALAILAFSLPAIAGLSDALDGMFMSTSTMPGVYESQTRYGFVGGSMAMRSPIKNMNIVSIDVPRIRAGCGGIDLYMGSFSFINGEQFKALLRSIGANAVGYAFKLAIETMCPTCASILQSLENLATKLNSMNKNSCEIAKGMVTDAFDLTGLRQRQENEASFISTIKGFYQDLTESFTEATAKPQEAIQNAGPDLTRAGNLVWRALHRSGAANRVGAPGFGTTFPVDAQMAQYIISITGTVIYPSDGSKPCDAGGDPSQCEKTPVIVAPTLTIEDLIEGGIAQGGVSSGKKYMRCADRTDIEMGCQDMTEADFTFEGTKGYVNRILFGVPDPESRGYTAGSIVGKVISGQGNSLTLQQQMLVDMAGVPLLAAMLRVQRNPQAVLMIAHHAAPWIAEAMAVRLGKSILDAAAIAFSGDNKVQTPPHWQETLADIRKMMLKYSQNAEQKMRAVVDMARFVEAIVNTQPGMLGPFRHPGS